MLFRKQHSPRRAEIRKNRPDTTTKWIAQLRAEGIVGSLWVAFGFFVLASGLMLMRQQVVPYRPGQWTPVDVLSRVDFKFFDKEELERNREIKRQMQPRIYKTNGDAWADFEQFLSSLPDRVTGSTLGQLSDELQRTLDPATLSQIQEYATTERHKTWADLVQSYVAGIRSLNPIVLGKDDRDKDLDRYIEVPTRGTISTSQVTYAVDTPTSREELAAKLNQLATANAFPLPLQPKIVKLTLDRLRARPTHVVDEVETAIAQTQTAERVAESEAVVKYIPGSRLADRGEIDNREYLRLRAENEAYVRQLGDNRIWSQLGVTGCVALLTIALAAYIAKYQPRVMRNHARAIAIAALLLSTLLLSQLAAIGSSPIFVFGVAPTILVAMILAIAYDQRFAVGVGFIHATLVTLAVGGPLSFLLIVWAGVATSCILLDDVRTRSKLIEVGGATALAMMLTSVACGLMSFDPPRYLLLNALYTGAAGLAIGFVVLGILPFIEKSFRITTSMTLLELADASHPLLRRLSLEAPGTYNHSLQVATLAEEAAEAIGANSLLCRVAAYYHDIGKMNKPDYFIENQSNGINRHLNLDPNLSLLIIIGHVKDGIEMAREYNLPTSISPFIQQHHGTTLVEYFYHRACTQQEQREPDAPAVSETQYRYPGPRPRSKEIGVIMLADCVESATRAMTEPTANRIETLVHDLAMKRLNDGQFDECDLTMRDLARIEKSLVKSLLGIYHGRIAYPSTSSKTHPGTVGAATRTA